jgi:hypothetical protein
VEWVRSIIINNVVAGGGWCQWQPAVLSLTRAGGRVHVCAVQVQQRRGPAVVCGMRSEMCRR